MAFISKNPKLTTTTLVDQVAGSVSSPASGSNKIINRNGILYLKSSAGVETPLGSGAAVKNYLSSVNDGSATAVLATITAAGAVVVSGTFPNVTSDWGRDSTSSIATSTDNSLRGTSNYLTAAGTSSTSGATFVQSPAFNIDGEDLGKALAVQFDVTGNTTANDWDCVAVRYGSGGVFGELIPIAGVASTTTGTASAQVPTGTTTFKGFFITGSAASDVYSIRWRRRAGTVQIRLDNLIVGPQSVMLGTAIQDIKTATAGMTWTNVTLGTATQVNVIKYGRAGDSATIYGTLELGTGGSFTGTVGGTIPTEIGTINTSVLNSSAVDYTIGSCWMRNENGASDPEYAGVVVYTTGTGLIQFVPNSTADSRVNATQPFTWAVGDRLSYTIQIPITGWSSNVTMADRAVEEYASNSSATDANESTLFVNGPAGSVGVIGVTTLTATRIKRVRFQTPIQQTDSITLEFQDNTNSGWVPVASFRYGMIYTEQNTGSYGSGIQQVNSTDVDVKFGQYAYANGATFGAAGVNWSSAVGTLGLKAWRVRKVASGGSVGFPLGARNVIGDTTGTAVPAGYIGEVLSQSRLKSATTLLTTATTANVTATALTLTAGVWDISGVVGFDINSATTVTILNAAIANSTASLPPADAIGVETSGQIRAVWTQASAANNSDRSMVTGTVRVAIAVSTTYFLVTQATFAVSTAGAYGSIRAVRIA